MTPEDPLESVPGWAPPTEVGPEVGPETGRVRWREVKTAVLYPLQSPSERYRVCWLPVRNRIVRTLNNGWRARQVRASL